MKEALKHIGTVVLWLFMIVIALALIILLIIPALGWKIWVSTFAKNRDKRKARDILTGTARFFEAIAISIDVFGGVAYSGMFNNLLLVNQVYRFGNPYETISEVLGWAQYYNDLTKTGKFLVKILDTIDPNHCEKTRRHGVILAYRKINLINNNNNDTTTTDESLAIYSGSAAISGMREGGDYS